MILSQHSTKARGKFDWQWMETRETSVIRFSCCVSSLQWTVLSVRLFTLFPLPPPPPPHPHTHRCPVCHCWLCEGLVFSGEQWLLQHSLPSHSALHEGILLPLFCLHPTGSQWHYWVSLNTTTLPWVFLFYFFKCVSNNVKSCLLS